MYVGLFRLIPQPIKEPAALGRASLPKRTAQTVTLTIEKELSFTNAAMEKRTETGWFTVTVGSESARIFVNEDEGDLMYRFSIIGLDHPEFAERICTDIAEQYRARISDCALFCMTLTPEGTPPVDKASILSEKFDVFRDRLEQSGFSCGILIQASIGHGYALNSPSPFRHYVNLTDGKEQDVCCPYDPDFRAFFREQTAELARHRPAHIMLDDDFRLMNRAGRGCACPLHMAEFNRRAGTSMTREELAACIDSDERLAEIFVETQKDSLLGAVKAYREGIDSVDPSIPGSFCCCGGEFGTEVAQIFAGKGNPVIVRLNNGNYTPAGARNLSVPMLRAAYQIASLSDGYDAVLAETDTCPQNRYSTGAMSLHSQFTGSILEGANGAKHWISRLHAEEPESGKAYRRILAKNAGFYEALAALVPTLKPVGCRIPMPTKWKSPYEKGAPSFGWSSCVLERLGFPMYFSKYPGGAVFLDGTADAGFSDDELTEMLRGPVFLSSEAAKRLIDRGFGADLGVDVHRWTGKNIAGEKLFCNGNSCETPIRPMELVPLSDDVRVHSIAYHVPDGKTEEPLFPAVTEYRNVRGGTVFVFCGDPKTQFNYQEAFSFLNESRKLQISELLSSVGCLPLWYPGDAEVYFRAASLPEGGYFAAFFNIGFDPLDEIPLRAEFPVSRIERLLPDGTRAECSFTYTCDTLRISVPAFTLDPVILFLYF